MLKRYLPVLMAAFAVLVVFSGCMTEEIPENAVWEKDFSSHWISDENGEKQHLGEHELDGANFCTVCKSEISDFGGNIRVIDYDEFRSPVREITYGSDGSIINERIYEYGYDGEGNYTFSKTFENGKLVLEYEYETVRGNNFPVKETGYEDGKIIWESLFADGVLAEKSEFTDGPEGKRSVFKTTFYNEGSCENYDVLIFDESGNQKEFYSYWEGELLFEEKYSYSENSSGETYCSEFVFTHYFSEIKTVIKYNEFSKPVSDESFNLAEELLSSYKYEYYEDGSYLRSGWETGKNGTETYKTLFDANGNEKSAVDYDSEGNILRGFPFGKYSSERIFTNHLNSNLGSVGIDFTVSEDSVLTEYNGESKTFEISDWEWEEFPFSKEEWAGFFDNPEQIIDLSPYGKIMYKPINDFHFMLSSNGDFAIVSLTYLNMGSYNQLVIWHIEKLIPTE